MDNGVGYYTIVFTVSGSLLVNICGLPNTTVIDLYP